MNSFKKALLISSAFLASSYCAEQEKKSVIEINSIGEFHKILNNGENKVIKFYAPWCGACKQMTEPYENIAKKNQDIKFYCVNLDKKEFKELHKNHKIEGYPTTIFFKGKEEVKRERGSLPERDLDLTVQEFIKK